MSLPPSFRPAVLDLASPQANWHYIERAVAPLATLDAHAGGTMRTSHLIADLTTYLLYGALIFIFVAGWIRWARQSQPRDVFSYLALIGFSLATMSLIIAVATLLYAQKIGGFPPGDPRLFRIFPWAVSPRLEGFCLP